MLHNRVCCDPRLGLLLTDPLVLAGNLLPAYLLLTGAGMAGSPDAVATCCPLAV
jgi:hypothetical protein